MEKGNILIVDDEQTHLLLLQNILEDEGYQTSTFSNPAEALEAIYGDDYDVVLLDIMMPKLDGFEILERIKTDKSAENTSIIIISAKNDFWSIKNAMDLGAFDYVTKPINIQDVKNKIKAAMIKNNKA